MVSGDATWWAQTPLPHPLASYALILYIFVKMSCIQINFQVQVELGEILSNFNTCHDDLPHFTLLLCEMLTVKMGVSDHQQAPPSYPFVVLSKDAV